MCRAYNVMVYNVLVVSLVMFGYVYGTCTFVPPTCSDQVKINLPCLISIVIVSSSRSSSSSSRMCYGLCVRCYVVCVMLYVCFMCMYIFILLVV